MRMQHIVGGIAALSIGLVLAYQNSAVVVDFLQAAFLLSAILFGFLALITAIKKPTYRKINFLVASHFLTLGLLMIYREYPLFLDFLSGGYPVVLLFTGGAAVISGFNKVLHQPDDARQQNGIIAHFVTVYKELFCINKDKNPYLKQSIIGGVVGNVLEWYDFAVFGFFAPVIATQFFPNQNHLISLICAYGVFAGSYFIRPFGGILFGYIGDRQGRKKALMLSVLLMAIPTGLIGFLPTYAQIGIWAPVLLVILRLAQGLSVGGELIGSISFVTEIAPPEHRGFFGSWAFCGVTGGILLGSLAATIAHNSLSPADLDTWGWRVPFIAGVVIGVLGLWMRTSLSETPEFENLKSRGQISENPFVEVLNTMPWRLVQLGALVVLSGGGFYLLFVWWPTFLTKFLVPPLPDALLLNTISMALLLVLIPIAGAISDKVGRRRMHIFGSAGVVVLAYPLFWLVSHGTIATALTAQLIFTLLLSIFEGPIPATMVELFPPGARYSGMALGYNISLCVFGGTAPLVATWLIATSGSINTIACYLTVMALISLVASISLKDSTTVPGDTDYWDYS